MKKFDKKYKKKSQLFGEKPLEIVEKAFSNYNISGKTIDLGCGQGRNTLYLIEKGYSIIGVDSSSVAINSLKKLDGYEKSFYVEDILNIFGKYDYLNIIATFTFNFLGSGQLNYIKKLQDCTPIGGIHIIQDFIEDELNKKNFLEYNEIKSLYINWEILFLDIVNVETLLKNKNGDPVYWKTYRLIAKKNEL